MIRNVPSVQRRMQLFGIYDINKTNGQNARIYSELNLKIRMISLELWQIGLGKGLLIGLSWWRLERIRYHLHNLSACQHDVVLQKSVVMKNLSSLKLGEIGSPNPLIPWLWWSSHKFIAAWHHPQHRSWGSIVQAKTIIFQRQHLNHGWRNKCSGCWSSCIRQSICSILKTIRYTITFLHSPLPVHYSNLFTQVNSKFPPGSTSSKLPPSKNLPHTIQIGSTCVPQQSHDTFISANQSV